MLRVGCALVAAVVAVTLALSGVEGAAGTQEPTLDVVLARAATYVAEYQKKLQGIVAEETYRQNVMSTAAARFAGSGTPGRTRGTTAREGRELKSDLLLVKLGNHDVWLQFRDVFEVDRKPVRDRDQRLLKLFVDAKADARKQAESIQAESARHNLGPVMRTINIPIMALLFFERGNQARITFEQGKAGNVRRFEGLAKPAAIWMIEYRETGKGTMVKGANDRDIPSHGRVWIDSSNGRILRTEQISEDTDIHALIDVSYKTEAGLDLLVPDEMREIYTIRRTETRIDGRATYGHFRQFTVSTTEQPKP
jgi:hypothetical protein